MLATPDLIHEAVQPHRLSALLPRWLDEVPLYRHYPVAAADATVNLPLLHEFHRLPLIDKSDIRRGFPQNFLREGVELEELLDRELVELEHTSGTSEVRTPLLLGSGWWAEQEVRALRLNRFVAGVLDAFPEARRVTINSPICSGDICYSGTPALADRIVGQALFTSLSRHPFLWSEGDLARMADETAAWQPQFLDVDPVYGALFARYCERRGIRLPSLRFILASYEFVSVTHRRILERVFGVPVFNLYGSTETGHLLMEGEGGDMVPSLDTAFLEVVATDHQGVGDLVVTTLTNDYMPLIRYRIGDLVERRETPYRTTYRVQGRTADAFKTSAGTRRTTLEIDRCLADVPGVLHYQLRQESESEWRLRYVPDDVPPEPAGLNRLRERLTQLLEIDGGLDVQPTDALLAENSGKFRLGYPLAKPDEPADSWSS